MTNKIICAGFGGQGLMSLGILVAYAGMLEGKEVSWYPSYGAEMRGGTANCSVIVSDDPIGSPVITNDASIVVAMNLPSFIKFEKSLITGGKLFINSSLIDQKTTRKDIQSYHIPANDIANTEGYLKLANMVMLGAVLQETNLVKTESILQALPEVFGKNKSKFIPINQKLIDLGKRSTVKN
ncbi:MAG: 2-oxoacid:acceptor oxidoreductase family protein [Treponemataceae bacterium]